MHPHSTDPQRDPSAQRGPAEVLAKAIAVLTEAARLTRPVLERDDAASEAAGHWVGRDTGRTEPDDWPAFVTLALAGAAANIGGVEAVLSGRPGSWEADGVRRLLTSTVGEGEAVLLEHRTEPLVVDLYVEEILSDLGAWAPYIEAQDELTRRYEALGIPSYTLEEIARGAEPTTDAQERQALAIGELEDRLDKQQCAEWEQYGEALRAAVEAAALALPGLRVPVVVNVDVETYRQSRPGEWPRTFVSGLIESAIVATPVPGGGRPPLERLAAAGEASLSDAGQEEGR